jgi:hypothetical protein
VQDLDVPPGLERWRLETGRYTADEIADRLAGGMPLHDGLTAWIADRSPARVSAAWWHAACRS